MLTQSWLLVLRAAVGFAINSSHGAMFALTPLSSPVPLSDIHLALDRALHSDVFRKSPSLSHLLRYLVTQAFEAHAEQIKESVIAIEVFERGSDFDGRTDNIVRVQAHRLRKTLDVYYATDGVGEVLRFVIPRGGYLPQLVLSDPTAEPVPEFSTTQLESEIPSAPAPLSQVSAAVSQPSATSFPRRFVAVMAGVFVAGLLLGAGIVMLSRPRHAGPPLPGLESPAAREAIAQLWGPIFEPSVPVKVTFTNPAFLRVAKSQMYFLYRGPVTAPAGSEIALPSGDQYIDWKMLPKDPHLSYSDGWTGTGEAMAINRLTLLGLHFDKQLVLAPSRALQFGDMKGSNVIFLGAASGNGELSRIGIDQAPIYETGNGRIENRDRRPGEPASFSNEINPATGAASVRYSLLSVLPGLEPDRKIVSSAGLGTLATWAGIDFATSPGGAIQLTRTLKLANGGKLPQYYQAVIRSEVIKGVSSNPSLVLTRIVVPPAGRR